MACRFRAGQPENRTAVFYHQNQQTKVGTMSPTVVLIGEDVGDANLARLREAHPNCDFRLCLDEESFLAVAPEAEIIFTKRFPAQTPDVATRLRWVQAGTAGVDRLLRLGLHGRDIVLTNATGAHGVPMAEQILAMMLAFATGLHSLIRAQTQHAHVAKEVIRTKFELAGQTLCVVGLGDIGGTLAQKALRLDMRVLGVRRSGTPFPGLHAQYTPDGLHEALSKADHVALCLPLTPATTAMIDEAELRAMRPSAYIYNVGRGASIAREPLLRALQEGWIAGAGLDVTDPEPLPPDSPLWEMPNVQLGQHTSGSSPYNAERITDIFLDNLARYRRGEPLRNLIDTAAGY